MAIGTGHGRGGGVVVIEEDENKKEKKLLMPICHYSKNFFFILSWGSCIPRRCMIRTLSPGR